MSGLERLLAALLLASSLLASPPGWGKFRSNSGFTIFYPLSWYRVDPSNSRRLDVRSSRGGLEGVVIREGQGDIIVIRDAELAGLSLPDVVHRLVAEGELVFQKRIPLGAAVGACPMLAEVVVRDAAVDPGGIPPSQRTPYYIFTNFVCYGRGAPIVVTLMTWEGDKGLSRYRATALRMALSLRVR